MTTSFYYEEMLGPIELYSLTLPLFIEVPVPSQESQQSCMCFRGIGLFNVVSIRIWNCFNDKIYYVFNFIQATNITINELI